MLSNAPSSAFADFIEDIAVGSVKSETSLIGMKNSKLSSNQSYFKRGARKMT